VEASGGKTHRPEDTGRVREMTEQAQRRAAQRPFGTSPASSRTGRDQVTPLRAT